MSLALALHDTAQHVVYLAGVSGDGTKNGAITTMVNRILGAVSVAVVAVFAIRAVLSFAKGKGGAEGHKELMHIGGQFVITEGLVFAAWAIARIGAQVFGGFAS